MSDGHPVCLTDSSMTEDVSYSGRYSSRNVPNRSNFSSSVPISVPAAWRQYSSHTSVEEEEDDRVCIVTSV